MGLEALVGHLAPRDDSLRGAVEQGAQALEAAVARLGQENLNQPADGQARALLGALVDVERRAVLESWALCRAAASHSYSAVQKPGCVHEHACCILKSSA